MNTIATLVPASVASQQDDLELSIVIPTFCERDNVIPLLDLIGSALAGIRWEAIFVDDNSTDGTAEQIWKLARSDSRVRCIKRVGRRGLSSACIEGMLSSPAPLLAVMDADLQHDPRVLTTMLEVMRRGDTDLVLASRYMADGSVGDWDAARIRISGLATRLAGLITRQPVSDPMSGYFMLRRETFEAALPRLSSLGFKILLDIIASSRDRLRLAEVPLTFRKRHAGESKLSANVAWEYLLLIGDKLVGRLVPIRFIAFGAVGAAGAAVHFAVLTLAFKGLQARFQTAEVVAVLCAVVFNFSLNNVLTYGDVALRGAKWWRGLLTFGLICGAGAVANVGIASVLFVRDASWQLAALAGVLVGSVWNYAVSTKYTWKT